MAALPPGLSGAATQTPLVIGGVSLSVPNSPSELGLGAGLQKKAVTELIGGGRVVASMGAQPKPVTITGALWAPDIATIVPLLRAYMVDGKERLVSWASERYYAKVAEFDPKYRFGGQVCDYSIVLEITRDANGAFSISPTASVDTQVSTLSDTANVSASAIAAADASAPPLTADAANVQIALDNTGPIGQASSADVASLLTTVQSALANATAYAGGLAQTASTYVTAQQYVTALTLIADNVQSGQSQRTIQVQGRSLFEVASQYYGDPSKAFDLAAVNGLAGPLLSGVVSTTLRLPPYPSTRA